MNKRTKVLAAGAALGLAAMLPLTVIGDDAETKQPPDRVSRRVQIVQQIQLVPHTQGETCPPTVSHAACKILAPKASR